MRLTVHAAAALLLAVVVGTAFSEEPVSKEPEGETGIASKYVGDVGIENDADVIFVEQFEGTVDEICRRWETVSGKMLMSNSGDVPPGSAGRRSLLITRVPGNREYAGGGQLYRRIKNENGGYGFDKVYLRMYMKFNEGHAGIHHYGTCLGGYHPSTKWPMVKAGQPTKGNQSFWSGVEPYGSWNWMFYTYWHKMRGSPPRGQTWGNSFQHGCPKLPIPKEKWICIESMLKVNDVGDTNGEQAFWVNGKLNRKDGVVVSHQGKGFPTGTWIFDKFHPFRTGQGVRCERGGARTNIEGGKPFEGYEWRTVKELNVNYIWLYRYMSKPETGKSQVWWDHVVAARKYIGPIATKKAARRPEPGKEADPAQTAAAEKENVDLAKAAKLYRSGRNAERSGMKALAKRLFERVVEEYPGTELAEQAKKRLGRLK